MEGGQKLKRAQVEWTNNKVSVKAEKSEKKKAKTKKAKPEPLTEVQEQALLDLDVLLTDLSVKYPCRSFNIGEITTTADIEMLRKYSRQTGCVFLTGAMSNTSLIEAKRNFVDAFVEMFKYEIPATSLAKIDRDNISSINQFRSAKEFNLGNASFAYLNKQYTTLADTPTSVIAYESVYFALNTVHAKVNIPLLMANTHTTAVLLALSHRDGMISWDSAKYASNPKPLPKGMTKQDLTKFHFDKYGAIDGAGGRIQAILVSEESVKLGYVPYTHLPEVQRLIAIALGKPKLYDGNGFIGTDAPYLTKVLQRHLIAPDTNSLVTWTETVIHAEATFSAPNSVTGICSFVSRKDQPNSDRFRFVVGTHVPSGLSGSDLVKLAHHCEKGIIPDFYFNSNRGKKVFANIKNGKSTQNKRPREISQDERVFIGSIIEEPCPQRQEFVHQMPPLKKHLYGITQPGDQLVEFSESDKKMLNF